MSHKSDFTPHIFSEPDKLQSCKLFPNFQYFQFEHHWTYVLCSDGTKINLFGSDGVSVCGSNQVRTTKTSVSRLQTNMEKDSINKNTDRNAITDQQVMSWHVFVIFRSTRSSLCSHQV